MGAVGASTNAYEKAYDTEVLNTNTSAAFNFYSILNSITTCPKLAIQGRQFNTTFNTNDVVHLGFSCPSGSYRIKLEGVEGIFTTQLIWLREQTAPGVFQYYDDIRTTGHLFTSSGDVDNTSRFQIVFLVPDLTGITFPVVCGTTLTEINTTLYSTQIAGATGYRFEVRENGAFPSGNVVGEYPGLPSAIYQFNLNLPAPITFNTTYWIRVATYQINGNWVYGNSCMVTTPPPPTSRIINPTCGIVTTNTWTSLHAWQVNNIYGINTDLYRFNATVGGVQFGNQTTPSPSSQCNLRSFGGTITPNTSYSITVDIFWAGQWRNGTVPCIITTGNAPLTRLAENGIEIFDATGTPNPFSENFNLEINTSSEEQISLQIFDMLGRQVESRIINNSDLNTQEIGQGYSSGIYNIMVKQGENIKTIRMIKR